MTEANEEAMEKIISDVGYIMDFQAAIELTQDEIDADEIRADITKRVHDFFITLKVDYPRLHLDHRFGYGKRNYMQLI